MDEFGGIVNAFASLDVDHNILLTRSEFISGCEKYQFPATLEELNELYTGFDLDGRGAVTALELLFLEPNPGKRKLYRQAPDNSGTRQRMRVRQVQFFN